MDELYNSYLLDADCKCRKEERLFICSLAGAVGTLFCSYFFAQLFGVFGMVLSNCLITLLLGLVWVTLIFFKVQVPNQQTEMSFDKIVDKRNEPE
jgi:hypothetical protein